MLENYATAAAVIQQYVKLLDLKELTDHIGHLAAYGMIQAMSQIMDTTESIYKSLGVRPAMRLQNIKQKKEYWKFRNRHTHIKTHVGTRSDTDPEGLDTHIFLLERTSAHHVGYVTIGENGYMMRTAGIQKMFESLQMDLGEIFEEIINHYRKNMVLRQEMHHGRSVGEE